MITFRKKNEELLLLVEEMNEVYEGEPWHGKSVKAVLGAVSPTVVFEKPGGQHSILELVWHMGNWKEFALNRLQRSEKDLAYFEERDWRSLDHSNTALWQEGVSYYWQVHRQFMNVLQRQDDKLLGQIVQGRKYNYRKLLHGLREHDVYHSGQIIYLNKQLTKA